MMELATLVRKNIQGLTPYSSARGEFSGSAEIFLDANENPFGTFNRYPDPYQQALKKEIAQLKDLPVENIFIGNGSDEAIDLLFRVFCEPGKDKALIFPPTYGMYRVSAQINDVSLIEVPLNNQFLISEASVAPFLKDPLLKLLFVCSPNNPTGNLIPHKTLLRLLKNFSGIVVVDEAYIDFSEGPSALELLPEFPNLVVLQTLSKAWGQAGLRIGFAFGASEIISYLNKVKPPYNVSSANQQQALKALQNSAQFEKNRQLILSEKKRMEKALEKIPGVQKIFPSETNFLLLQIENAPEIYRQLIAQKIIVRNRDRQIENTLRITIGCPSENEKLLQTLQNITS
ncbi:MAG: histidinol-phosphate transaminase [Flavobacteriaceae bacterium]|nr:histidinol-phosphate transaminase [Flavobacteriaceae bacterium]|tara:strand:- start:51359 stop:52390 length:1032 start_codon:yes stop_codon:yes gene_type:complete